MKIKKRSQFDFWNSKRVLISLVIFALIFTYYAFQSSYQKYQMQDKISILDAQIIKLEDTKSDLKDDERRLTDEGYIEKEARIKLNFKKAGEKVVIFVDEPYIEDSINIKESQTLKKKASGVDNIKKWVDFIFN